MMFTKVDLVLGISSVTISPGEDLIGVVAVLRDVSQVDKLPIRYVSASLRLLPAASSFI